MHGESMRGGLYHPLRDAEVDLDRSIARLGMRRVVVKYGGAAMVEPSLQRAFAGDIALLRAAGVEVVVVHGGGKEISGLAHDLDIESTFVDGQRYTDEKMIEIVLMVLAGKINKELVGLIHASGADAVGVCGVDNGMLRARKLESEQDLGLVGTIASVDPTLLELFLRAGMVPVVAPAAIGDDGKIYNVNADVAAAAIASAIGAEALIFMSDVDGVYVDGIPVARLSTAEARLLMADGSFSNGMIPKITSAIEAVESGVDRIQIVDGRRRHCVLDALLDRETGTRMEKVSGVECLVAGGNGEGVAHDGGFTDKAPILKGDPLVRTSATARYQTLSPDANH